LRYSTRFQDIDKHKVPPAYSRADDNARSLYGMSG